MADRARVAIDQIKSAIKHGHGVGRNSAISFDAR
jgi:hypothetical protein